ncbi:MAG: PHB depolymerase family esterase [Bacteroidota bacterium]
MKNNYFFNLGLAAIAVLLLSNVHNSFAQTGWSQVTGFGTNPGSLLMYKYVPVNVAANAPLVVVLHGCTQTASVFETDSEWDSLAEQNSFYVIHAQQQYLNNTGYCFNWYLPSDYSRNQGEVYSVKQMVDNMKSNYSIDDSRVFTTGVSAGAGLSVALLGAYPEIFNAGAIMSGAPYKSASDAIAAYNVMNGLVTKTAVQWGDLVRNENPGYSGTFPRVAIFQGTNDITVSPVNAGELVKQWTNVHAADQVADSVNSAFNGNNLIERKDYFDNSGNTVVRSYMISSMAHAIAVDPGNCFQQGGSVDTYAYDKNFYSSFWAAEFFGIIQFPYQITGPINVFFGQTNIVFSVPFHAGSSYSWSFPAGVTIVSGQGTSQITVNWGTVSGQVSVSETTSSSCKVGPLNVFVNATVGTIVENFSSNDKEISVGYTLGDNQFTISTTDEHYSVYVFDAAGKLILLRSNLSGNNSIQLPEQLAPGMYLIKIVSGKEVFNRKYLKMKF